jgi:hypothetical protein
MSQPPRRRQTFHESPARRSLAQRATPLTWLVVAIAALLLVLGSITAFRQLSAMNAPLEPLPDRLGTPTLTQ